MIDLKKAITSLVENNVDFVVVGGVAINLHSSAYITQDLDLCYSRAPDNIERLFQALARFNPRLRNFPEELPFVFDKATLRNGTNFTFETTIGDIDLLGEVKGLGDYADALKRSVVYEVYGARIRALGLNALIDTKIAADRPKDHLVLPELYALREALDPNEE
jgi:hypothetical protein